MIIRCATFAVLALVVRQPAEAEIDRIWLTHRGNDPSKIVVNWESAEPGDAAVCFGLNESHLQTVRNDECTTLHHVEIPMPASGQAWRYRVASGSETSAQAVLRGYPEDMLRIAIAGNWQARPALDAIEREDVHLLLTAGDNIDCLHRLCGVGVRDCVKPYSELIGRYPALFRTTPLLPVLGNHDREIRPRGPRPPAEPVYDVEAVAYRRFFELPDDEWKWRFELPAFGLRLVGLDLNHISDMGTTWQTCHRFDRQSDQYGWYRDLMSGPAPPWVVTVYNERHANIRGREAGSWHEMFRQGTLAVTGFGYFAERAELDDFTYYNTSLSGRGDKYPDPHSKFLASEDSYLLLTLTARPPTMVAELKSLEGRVLDRKQFAPRPR